MGGNNERRTIARALVLGCALLVSASLIILLTAKFVVDRNALFADASERIDSRVIGQACMDARAVDIDADGDLDLVLSMEREPNRVLLNDGRARFSALDESRLPQPKARDSEMAAVFDANGDGLLDIVFATEDDEVNEYFWQSQTNSAPSFVAAPQQLPVRGRSNAVIALDLNGDGYQDLIIGNDGPNFALINDGAGRFTDESQARLGARADTTQDVAAGDVDGDGDLDLVFGNEGPNRLMINDGQGHFRESKLSEGAPRETRDVDLVDINGDERLDLVVSNVRLRMSDSNNQLLVGDGTGGFELIAGAIPRDDAYTFDAEALDVDGDGKLEILFGNAPYGASFFERALAHFFTNHVVALRSAGSSEREKGSVPVFKDASRQILGFRVAGATFDLAQGDFDGDGHVDLYVCNKGHNRRDHDDVLLLRRSAP